jgi:L-lactate dehydrogenase complex protein LldG
MSRATILANVRQNGFQGGDLPVAHTIPARGRLSPSDGISQFQEALISRGAEVISVRAADGIPAAIRTYFLSANLTQVLRAGSDPLLRSLKWDGIALLEGAAEGGDHACLSRAAAGISESGTLMLVSGRENPATLAFLPEVHFVVLEQKNLKANMEEALSVLDTEKMPRSVNFISGPSCTADIGGRLVYGAHGPKRLIVIVVEMEGARISGA